MPSPRPPRPTLQTHILPPPGSSVLSAPIPLPSTSTSSHLSPIPTSSPTPPQPIPPLFLSALVVRTSVFIHEQRCSAENEIDSDDARSWHWVTFASSPTNFITTTSSPSSFSTSEEIRGEERKEWRPAATLRLVPPPHHSGGEPIQGIEEPNMTASSSWDQREPYIKIGRLATVKEFRGLGIAGSLVRESIVWAGEHKDEISEAGRVEGDGREVEEGEEGREWKGLVLIHAQSQLEGWYKSLGFESDEGLGVFTQEGIKHFGMWARVRE